MGSAAVGRSTLNPNAPLFIPAAYKQVEDFSPEWWELVNTTGWYREHWFQQHREEETFEREDVEDVANLLPDSIDLAITDGEFSGLGADFVDEEGFFAAYDVIERGVALRKEDLMSGNGVQSPMRSLSLKSTRNGAAVAKPVLEPAKCKAPQCVGLKFSPRRIIQQPR